ncbi:hypothetical protein JQ615_37705 [Bradyrhizobium jicamae]|uniref:Flp pilus-assembly TadG-like N-terminal domain-containing protein n=1 Tax=Bradyrhizobium jicamae TaxID=280332 RepID=A0ABS5FWA1_9BRAD|nr:pilus assembly protein TadG-related protein [Bradyrhizobium jicamae]MBR0801110.1 hypothetical protein [Bradyrhizobium jicamae]
MRNMLRCRRGSAAFATLIALVPLIGVMALGGEAGFWYVTQQRAQNAADAAAYSGGMWVACSLAPTICPADTQTMTYRAKEFAAQNGFCTTGDTSYPGSRCVTLASGLSQAVTIASLATWNGVAGNYVQATVSQSQPAYLAKVLGMSTVTIGATAVARVDTLAQPPCVLSLTTITFQGSPTLSSTDCGVAADSSASNSIGFVGNNGISMNAPSYAVGSCAQTGGSQCTNVNTYQQTIPDPLSTLNTALSALTTSSFAKGSCTTAPTSFESGACYNGSYKFPNTTTTLSGTYYFNGSVTIQSSAAIVNGTATLIIFGGGSLTIGGGPTIQLTAMASPTGPSALSASALALMKGLVLYDNETTTKNGSVNVSGNTTSYLDGTVYMPNAAVNYGGNSTSSAPSPGCYQVIAYQVNFTGNTTLDNSGCAAGSVVQPNVQTVRLVQ